MSDAKISREDVIRMARERWQDEGRIEIDDDAVVSEGDPDKPDDGGCYVEAWVWIDFPGKNGGAS